MITIIIVVIVINITHHQLYKRKHSLISNSKHGTGRNFPSGNDHSFMYFFHFFHVFPGKFINDSVISVAFFSIDQKVFYWKKGLFSSWGNNKHFLSQNKHFWQRKHKNECFRKINSRKPQCRKTKIKDKINRKKPPKKYLEFEFFVRTNYLQ